MAGLAKKALGCALTLTLACATAATADPAGKTTVQETIRATGSGFKTLIAGPGEGYKLRQGALGKAKSKRKTTRRSLLYFAQFSDTHIRDAQSTARVDFVDAAGPPLQDAFRPNETLTTQVFDQVVANVNANRTSGVRQGNGKHAKLGFAVMTGDLTDNQQFNEVQWFARVLAGGTLDPFSGKPITPGGTCSDQPADVIARLNADVAARHYTGVGDYSDYSSAPNDRKDAYYDPNQAPPDPNSPFVLFPRYPGLLDKSQQPFAAQGLKVPYFLSRGNHDGEIQGNIAATFGLARALIAGCQKILPNDQFDPKTIAGLDEAQLIEKFRDPAFQQKLLAGLRPVPPDPDRRFVSAKTYRSVFSSAPKDAGYSYVSAKERKASKSNASYYAWSPKRAFRFISMDTVAEGGGQHGNIDNPQYKWLEGELKAATKRKQLIVVFGHHPLDRLSNKSTDESAGKCASSADEPGCDRDPRKSTPLHLGLTGKANIRALLLKYKNVIAFVNGHKHRNQIKSFPAKNKRSGFWEINTASHTDWPEQARLIDLEDNRDGTLSFFTALIDSAAPIQPPPSGSDASLFSVPQLASISRILAANDAQTNPLPRAGARTDRNVELIIRDPR